MNKLNRRKDGMEICKHCNSEIKIITRYGVCGGVSYGGCRSYGMNTDDDIGAFGIESEINNN
jgi:hypothetical protein